MDNITLPKTKYESVTIDSYFRPYPRPRCPFCDPIPRCPCCGRPYYERPYYWVSTTAGAQCSCGS